MCSVSEPRRATVSCKHIFSSPTTNERPTPAFSSSSSRRYFNNNSNAKRNPAANANVSMRSSTHSTKKQPPPPPPSHRLTDITNDNQSSSNVFHIPFSLEHSYGNEPKSTASSTAKFFRTPLNPLSPAFFSTRHTSLPPEQKPDAPVRYDSCERLRIVSEACSSSSAA